MKKLLTLIAFAAVIGLAAQNIPPQAINFQGVAIDKNGIPVPGMDELGNPIQNSAIRVRFSILTGSTTGTVSYQEEHLTSTDEFGRFNLEIGRGTATNGTFTGINWGGDKHFLQVEVDLSALGTNYTLASVQEFLSVPYALYAKTAGSTGDGDTDATNELQELSLSGNLLTISGGNTVTLPSSSDNQTLSIVGTTLTISNGNSVVIPDAQTLSLNGTSLSISNGNSVTLPANTDNQTLSLVGNTLSISNGNSIVLPNSLDNDSTNEIQDLVLNGTILGLTKSGVTVNLSSAISNSSGNVNYGLCVDGGTYYNLSSLFATYSSVNVDAVVHDKLFINCYTPATGNSKFILNRQTGSISPVSIPSSVDWMRSSDSIVYMFSGNFVYVYNSNKNTYSDTLTVLNNSGTAAVDYKTNRLVLHTNTLTFSYNPASKVLFSIPKPSGLTGYSILQFVGSDSIYIGNSLYNSQNMTVILNNSLSNVFSDKSTYIRPLKKFIYTNTINQPFASPLNSIRTCDVNGGNVQEISNTIGGGPDVRGAIEGKALIEYSGGVTNLNNYWISIASSDGVMPNGTGGYKMADSKEWLLIEPSGLVSSFLMKAVSGLSISDFNKNTVVKLPFVKNCHNGTLAPQGIVVFDKW